MATVDPNSVAVSVGTALVKDFLKSLSETVSKNVSQKYSRYFSNFSAYLDRTYESCNSIKTILNKEKPSFLSEIYVKTRFKCGREVVDDDSLCQAIRDNRRIVVTGFGGIGKTIFCKYLFNSIFSNPSGKIPLFFELRKLNELSNKNLFTAIRISSSADSGIISEEVFLSMMSDGRFIFILDGFDELPDELRVEAQKQILELSHHYRQCGFVVSSRNDRRFSSWQEYYVYQALPFEREQTKEVIEKVEFDNAVRKEFISNILNKRYTEYKDFFATPLLTLMMLMTYLQIRHIPDNVHVFYRYAFQTLFTLHDASKQGFQRKRRLDLSEQEFMEIFSFFSISSYAEMSHNFTEEKCISYIDRALKRANRNLNPSDFLNDCVESVNLLFKDGDQYTFIHRSFQEYFSAYALTHFFVKGIREAVKRLPMRETDSVCSMMRSMNPSFIDEMYIFPEYDSQENVYKQVLREQNVLNILNLSDYQIELGFDLRGKSSVGSLYSSYGKSDFEWYVVSVFLMFKEDAPVELQKRKNGKIFSAFADVTKQLMKHGFIEGNSHLYIDVKIDFGAGTMNVLGTKNIYESEEEIVVNKQIRLSEVPWIGELPLVIDAATSLKSKAVFVKRKIDELRRRQRRSLSADNDILSI